ncbi:MAG TPA: ABC transporter substrate-binding protein [Nevskiaceae bacterium]|nr:ABC transporter substrate-binding protein [Nevskiaceae bacterium]
MIQKFLTLAFATLLLAFAAAAPAQTPATPPDVTVKKGTEELLTKIRANHEKYASDLDAFYKEVDATVVPYFDTKGIAQLVLGRNWKTATEDQRKRFEAAFKNSLIRTYARAMLDYYDSVNTEWQPLRAEAGATDVTVNCKLLRTNNAPPIPLAFSMHVVDGAWKIYDISVENLSLATNFRSQINVEVKTNGLDATIQKFENNQVLQKPETSG